MSHQVYPYDATSHYGIPSMASYEAVIRNLSLKQVVAAAAINADQRVDYQPQQHQSHSEQQQRYRDAELSHQQRSSALLVNSSIDRPMFPSSPHRAAVIYHPHVSSYASPRPPPVVLDSSSTVKRPRLMSDFTENKNEFRPLHIEVEPKRADSVATGSAYKPQVEAISPTLPADDAHGNEIRHSIDELVSHIHRVDRDIQHLSNNLEKLKKKQELIEEEAKRPVGEKMTASEPNVDGRSQSISQTIYAENRQKVAVAHAALNKYGRATIMPLYAQPSDTPIFHENKAKFASFKKTLVLFLKKQQHAARIRERYLSERYDKLLESWSKRLEKMEKRRLKDTKTREFFEKVFPEIKKQREDKERLQRVSGNRLSGYARSDANVEQIVENLQEQEEEERKMRNLAVVPPMLLDSRQRLRRYRNDAGLLEDAVQVNMESMSRMLYWTQEEKDIFREKYLQRPKNFGFIAAALENKTASDCVLFYYTSKKSAMYKQLVRRNNASSRKRKLKTVKVEMITAQASREAKEKLVESIEQESSSITAVQEKKVEPEGSGKLTPVVTDEPEVSRVTGNVEKNAPALGGDASSNVEPECARSASAVSEAIDERHNGIMCVDGSFPCPDDSGGSGTYDKLGDDSDSMYLGTPEKQRLVSSPFITGGVRLDKASERIAVVNGATLDKKPLDVLKMNPIPSELTAAQLIEAIIAQETQPSNRRRAGSRSSNCSDHTSDTLSADESQSESTTLRSVPAISNATHAERHGDNEFSLLRSTALDANNVPHPLTYELLQSALLSGKLKNMSAVSGTDLKNIPHEINEPRLVLHTSGSVLHPLTDRKASSQKALPGNVHLRVRDVIHSAIEENLQARPVTGDPNLLRSSDELWKIYSQPPHVKLEASNTRMIGQHGIDSSQVQDLSCRRLDNTMQSKDAYSVTSRMWASEGQSGRVMQSPPPAHSHYKLQQPIQAVQIDPRSQDPLYHLAEVAVQRERAEVGERYPNGESPQISSLYVRDADQNIHLPHIGGSISRGTPLHTEEQMRRLAGLNRPEPTLSGRRNDPIEVAKPFRDSYSQGANPQVVAMAENVLQYMNPLPNQRAVMEQTIAAIQPHPHVATGNASMSVLMSDFLTAQKMLTTNTAAPRHRLPLQPDQLVIRTPTSQSSVPRSIHDLDMSYHIQRESHNGMIPRTVSISRSEIERSTESITPLMSSVSMPGNHRLTAATMIEAIITKEIRDTSAPGMGSSSQTELVNRILDPHQPVSTSQDRAVNGMVSLSNGFPSTSSSSGLANRFSVNDRIELERNALAASRFKPQERSAAVSTVAQSVEHAVTLGEHIDAMIQKDFCSSRFGDDAPHTAESAKYAGSSIDAGTKTSLRSFLENSADFNANSSSRIQDSGTQKSCGPDVMRSNARKSPVIAVSSNSGIGRSPWPRDSHLTDVSISLANLSGNLVQKPRVSSPSITGGSLNMVPIGSTVAFITKTSASGPTFSLASLPISHAISASLNRHVASHFSQASPILTGLHVPQQLQEVFAANMLNAASALKAGLPIQWPTMPSNGAGSLSDVVSTAAAAVEDDAPPIMVWKKKMSHELQQRQEQERSAEQKTVTSQTSSQSRPTSRSVTPAASSEQEKSMRLASEQATRTSFSSSWLTSSGSRDGFSEPAAALKSTSPRSPRASGVCEKPLSTIALSHQTMSSLLQSRPVFAIDKSPADGTSISNGRTAVGADNPIHPSSTLSDSVQMSTSFPESPAKSSPAEQSASNADVSTAERVVPSPVRAIFGSTHDSGVSNGDAQN